VPQPLEPPTPTEPFEPAMPIDPDPGTPGRPEEPLTVPQLEEPPTPVDPDPGTPLPTLDPPVDRAMAWWRTAQRHTQTATRSEHRGLGGPLPRSISCAWR
jgi:hypothetical protein